MTKNLKNLVDSANFVFANQKIFFSNTAAQNWKTQPAQMSSITENVGRVKMQEIGEFTWDRLPHLATQVEIYNHTPYYQFQEVKGNYNIQDLNYSIFKKASVNHKEIAEKTKDHTLNIRSYYRNRWIQEHKEKRKDNITKQAVKISPKGLAVVNRSWQAPHEASIYRKLVSKQFFDEESKGYEGSNKLDDLSESKKEHSRPDQLNKNLCNNMAKQNLEFSKLNSQNHYYQWIKSVSTQGSLFPVTQMMNCTHPKEEKDISDTLGSKSISNPQYDVVIITNPKNTTLNTKELGEDAMNTTSVQLEKETSIEKNVISIN
ncbi:uncharacterized protein LOC106664349 isoform X2 [Cimex lectularius]|uniref:Uncharacterized protein n=1 Tax=Cimex lectularius TaxID=79782 RepID=A0A8I6RHK8_CIMLE|nr:uncharacterized protein LOC106664349 isoform X2 [Cimex lectularius]